MLSEKEINRLNRLFGRELGFNRYGEPNYKWQWSETFMHRMVLEGKKNWNRRELPKSVLDGKDAALYVVEPVTQLRKMCPFLNNQWLITKWYWSTEEEWLKNFGTTLEWPRRGFYLYVDNTYLPHGQDPTVHITESFISGMKAQLEKTFADFMEESELGLAKEERDIDNHIKDVLDDATPAFSNYKPGSRSGDISIPSPNFVRNFQKL